VGFDEYSCYWNIKCIDEFTVGSWTFLYWNSIHSHCRNIKTRGLLFVTFENLFLIHDEFHVFHCEYYRLILPQFIMYIPNNTADYRSFFLISCDRECNSHCVPVLRASYCISLIKGMIEYKNYGFINIKPTYYSHWQYCMNLCLHEPVLHSIKGKCHTHLTWTSTVLCHCRHSLETGIKSHPPASFAQSETDPQEFVTIGKKAFSVKFYLVESPWKNLRLLKLILLCSASDHLNEQKELKYMFTCEWTMAATVIVHAVILTLRKRHQRECFLFLQSPDAFIWKK
jgi:hypothetical protein